MKLKPKHSGQTLYRRATAFVLILALALPSGAGPGGEVSAAEPALPVPQFDISKAVLPAGIGRVDSFHAGSGKRTVILIQDAHGIPEAQRNIRKLIEHFQNEYGVRLVTAEGAASKIDARLFRNYPDAGKLETVFEGYLEAGELTGTNAAALFNQSEAVYAGVEDWKLYERGLGLYLASAGGEKAASEKLALLEQTLQAGKEKFYSKELLETDRALRAFQNDSLDFAETLKVLARTRRPDETSALAALLREIEKQEGPRGGFEADARSLAAQALAAVNSGTPAPKPENLKAFHEKHQQFQTSQLPAEAFVLFLKEWSAAEGIRLDISGALDEGTLEQKRLRDIQGSRFFADFEQYASSVKETLFRNQDERKLDAESARLDLASQLVRLQLSRAGWERIKSLRREDAQSLPFESLADHLAFYENAEARDSAFTKSLGRLMDEETTDTAILVAGGFHAEGLVNRLKASGVSLLSVRPDISVIPETDGYRGRMQGDVSWKNYFKVEKGKIDLNRAFVRAARDRLLGSSGAEKGKLLKVWRDNVIRDLSKRGEITKARRYTDFLDEAASDSAAHAAPVEKFIQGLRRLEAGNRLNEQQILGLLKTGTIASVEAAGLAHHSVIVDFTALAAAAQAADPAAVRSELRAPDEDREKALKTLKTTILPHLTGATRNYSIGEITAVNGGLFKIKETHGESLVFDADAKLYPQSIYSETDRPYLVLSPDGKYGVLVGKKIEIFERATLKVLVSENAAGAASEVVFSPNSRMLAIRTDAGPWIYDLEKKETLDFTGFDMADRVRIDEDGYAALIKFRRGPNLLINLQTGKQTYLEGIRDTLFSHPDKVIQAKTQTLDTVLLDYDGTPLYVNNTDEDSHWLKLSADRRLVFIGIPGDSAKRSYLFDIQRNAPVEFPEDFLPPKRVNFTGNSNLLWVQLGAEPDSETRLFEYREGQLREPFKGRMIREVRISEDEKKLFIHFSDGYVLTSPGNPEAGVMIPAQRSDIWQLSDDLSRLVVKTKIENDQILIRSHDFDGQAWELPEKFELNSFEGMGLSQDGKYLFIKQHNGPQSNLTVYNLETRKPLPPFSQPDISRVSYVKNSTLLWVGHQESASHLYDLEALESNPVFTEITGQAGKAAPLVFDMLFQYLDQGKIQTTADLSSILSEIIPRSRRFDELTTKYNIERMLKVFRTHSAWSKILERGEDPLRHLDFYLEVMSGSKRLALQLLEGIFKGLDENIISYELNDEERKSILWFAEKTRNFDTGLYGFYRKEGESELDALLAVGEDIAADAVGPAEKEAFEKALNDKGYDGEALFFAVVQKVIPPSGASFVAQSESRGLMKTYWKLGDKRGHVPAALKALGAYGGGRIARYIWRLKTGEAVDPEDRIAELIQKLTAPSLLPAEKESVTMAARKRFAESLRLFLLNDSEQSRNKALADFLSYAALNDELRQKVEQVRPDEYVGLDLLEQIFTDKDNLSVLVHDVLDKDISPEPGEKIKNGAKIFRTALEAIWQAALEPGEKREKIKRHLARAASDEIRKDILTDDIDPGLEAVVEEILSARTPFSIPEQEIVLRLFEAPVTAVRIEKEKYEALVSPDSAKISFRIVKGPAAGSWGLCAGVCIATDTQLWQDPNFFLMAMYDETAGEYVGFAHLYQRTINGRKYLFVPGIEPNTEVLSEIKASELYPLIEEALITAAEAGGYDELSLPSDSHILSNRADIDQIVRRKKYPEKTLEPAVSWNHVPRPYPFKKVFTMWTREAGAAGQRSELRDGAPADPLRTREEGEGARIAKLAALGVEELGEFYFTLGDFDLLSAVNKLLSKQLVGTLGPATSPDIYFSRRSLYRESRDILNRVFDGKIHRFVGGDEIAPEFDGTRKQVKRKLTEGVREFTKAFSGRYAILRIMDDPGLGQAHIDELEREPDILVATLYDTGVNLLVDREKLSAAQLDELKARITSSLGLRKGQLRELRYEKANRGIFTISLGSLDAGQLLSHLVLLMGEEEWIRGGKLRPDRVGVFYQLGMMAANDMLKRAKDGGRNRAFLAPRTADIKNLLVKQFEPEKIRKQQEKIETGRTGIDTLTGFLNPGAYRDRLRTDFAELEEFVRVTVGDYGLGNQRSFHLLQERVGYEGGNAVIQSMSAVLPSLFGWDAATNAEPLATRLPPDSFDLAAKDLSIRAPPDYTAFNERVRPVLAKAGLGDLKPNLAIFKVTKAQIRELQDTPIVLLFSGMKIVSAVDWLYDIMTTLGMEQLREAADVTEHEGYTLVEFSTVKIKRLYELYRDVQEAQLNAALAQLRKPMKSGKPAPERVDLPDADSTGPAANAPGREDMNQTDSDSSRSELRSNESALVPGENTASYFRRILGKEEITFLDSGSGLQKPGDFRPLTDFLEALRAALQPAVSMTTGYALDITGLSISSADGLNDYKPRNPSNYKSGAMSISIREEFPVLAEAVDFIAINSPFQSRLQSVMNEAFAALKPEGGVIAVRFNPKDYFAGGERKVLIDRLEPKQSAWRLEVAEIPAAALPDYPATSSVQAAPLFVILARPHDPAALRSEIRNPEKNRFLGKQLAVLAVLSAVYAGHEIHRYLTSPPPVVVRAPAGAPVFASEADVERFLDLAPKDAEDTFMNFRSDPMLSAEFWESFSILLHAELEHQRMQGEISAGMKNNLPVLSEAFEHVQRGRNLEAGEAAGKLLDAIDSFRREAEENRIQPEGKARSELRSKEDQGVRDEAKKVMMEEAGRLVNLLAPGLSEESRAKAAKELAGSTEFPGLEEDPKTFYDKVMIEQALMGFIRFYAAAMGALAVGLVSFGAAVVLRFFEVAVPAPLFFWLGAFIFLAYIASFYSPWFLYSALHDKQGTRLFLSGDVTEKVAARDPETIGYLVHEWVHHLEERGFIRSDVIASSVQVLRQYELEKSRRPSLTYEQFTLELKTQKRLPGFRAFLRRLWVGPVARVNADNFRRGYRIVSRLASTQLTKRNYQPLSRAAAGSLWDYRALKRIQYVISGPLRSVHENYARSTRLGGIAAALTDLLDDKAGWIFLREMARGGDVIAAFENSAGGTAAQRSEPRPDAIASGQKSVLNTVRSELRWKNAEEVYRDLDKLYDIEALNRGRSGAKLQKKQAIFEIMAWNFDAVAALIEKEMSGGAAASVFVSLSEWFDKNSAFILKSYAASQDMESLRRLSEWNKLGLASPKAAVKTAAFLRERNIQAAQAAIRSVYTGAYQQAVGRKRFAAELMGLAPSTYNGRAKELGIDFAAVALPKGTLLARIAGAERKTPDQVKKELLELFRKERGGKTHHLVSLRKELAAKASLKFLRSPGFSYARMLWGLDLTDEFTGEYERRLSGYGGMVIRAGESFGFQTGSAKANMDRIIKEIAALSSAPRPVRAPVSLLKAIGMSKDEVVKELKEKHRWRLRDFVKAHPEAAWVVTRGYAELSNRLGIKEEMKAAVREAYQIHLGHYDYAAAWLGIETPAYKKMAEDLKAELDKVEFPEGSFLKALNYEKPEEKKKAILARLVEKDWQNLSELKAIALEGHPFMQVKIFTAGEMIHGLGLTEEFAARYVELKADPRMESPHLFGMRFGWPKGSSKPTLESVLRYPEIEAAVKRQEARSELRSGFSEGQAEKIDRVFDQMESVLDEAGSGSYVQAKSYLLQLKLMNVLGLLGENTNVLNVLSGSDLFPGLYAGGMWTSDKRESSDEILRMFRDFYYTLTFSLRASRKNGVLPDRKLEDLRFQHEQVDVMDPAYLAAAKTRLKEGDVVLLKFVPKYLKLYGPGDAEIRTWILGFARNLPDGVILAIQDEPPFKDNVFQTTFAQALLDDESGLFHDALPGLLSPAQKERFDALNRRTVDFKDRTRLTPQVSSTDKIMSFASGGLFSILRKGGASREPEEASPAPLQPDSKPLLAELIRKNLSGDEILFADLASGPTGEFGRNLKTLLSGAGLKVNPASVSIDNQGLAPEAVGAGLVRYADLNYPEDITAAGIAPDSLDAAFLNNLISPALAAPALRLLKPGGYLFITFALSDLEGDYAGIIEAAREKILGSGDGSFVYRVEEIDRPEDYPASNIESWAPYVSYGKMLLVQKLARVPETRSELRPGADAPGQKSILRTDRSELRVDKALVKAVLDAGTPEERIAKTREFIRAVPEVGKLIAEISRRLALMGTQPMYDFKAKGLFFNFSFQLMELTDFSDYGKGPYYVLDRVTRDQLTQEEFFELRIQREGGPVLTVGDFFKTKGLGGAVNNLNLEREIEFIYHPGQGVLEMIEGVSDNPLSHIEIGFDEKGNQVSSGVGEMFAFLRKSVPGAASLFTMHFHPDDDTFPSPRDMETSAGTGLPELILSPGLKGHLWIPKDTAILKKVIASRGWEIFSAAASKKIAADLFYSAELTPGDFGVPAEGEEPRSELRDGSSPNAAILPPVDTVAWDDQAAVLAHFKALFAELEWPLPRLIYENSKVVKVINARPLNVTVIREDYANGAPFPQYLRSFAMRASDPGEMGSLSAFLRDFGVMPEWAVWFRSSAQMESIRDYAASLPSDRPLKILVHAAWHGEDAYAIAAMLDALYPGRPYEISGVDIHPPEIKEINWAAVKRFPDFLRPYISRYFDYQTANVVSLKKEFIERAPVALKQGDLLESASYGTELDIVVANAVLGQSINEEPMIERAIENVFNALRPGGRFYVDNTAYKRYPGQRFVAERILAEKFGAKFDKLDSGIYVKTSEDAEQRSELRADSDGSSPKSVLKPGVSELRAEVDRFIVAGPNGNETITLYRLAKEIGLSEEEVKALPSTGVDPYNLARLRSAFIYEARNGAGELVGYRAAYKRNSELYVLADSVRPVYQKNQVFTRLFTASLRDAAKEGLEKGAVTIEEDGRRSGMDNYLLKRGAQLTSIGLFYHEESDGLTSGSDEIIEEEAEVSDRLLRINQKTDEARLGGTSEILKEYPGARLEIEFSMATMLGRLEDDIKTAAKGTPVRSELREKTEMAETAERVALYLEAKAGASEADLPGLAADVRTSIQAAGLEEFAAVLRGLSLEIQDGRVKLYLEKLAAIADRVRKNSKGDAALAFSMPREDGAGIEDALKRLLTGAGGQSDLKVHVVVPGELAELGVPEGTRKHVVSSINALNPAQLTFALNSGAIAVMTDRTSARLSSSRLYELGSAETGITGLDPYHAGVVDKATRALIALILAGSITDAALLKQPTGNPEVFAAINRALFGSAEKIDELTYQAIQFTGRGITVNVSALFKRLTQEIEAELAVGTAA